MNRPSVFNPIHTIQLSPKFAAERDAALAALRLCEPIIANICAEQPWPFLIVRETGFNSVIAALAAVRAVLGPD